VFIFGTGKTRTAGLLSGEGRTMIDSVVCAQYINTYFLVKLLTFVDFCVFLGVFNLADFCNAPMV